MDKARAREDCSFSSQKEMRGSERLSCLVLSKIDGCSLLISAICEMGLSEHTPRHGDTDYTEAAGNVLARLDIHTGVRFTCPCDYKWLQS